MQVLKFGGTSVANGENINKVVDLVQAALTKDSTILIVSALGGITDVLIRAGELAAAGDETYKEELQAIELRHLETRCRHRERSPARPAFPATPSRRPMSG